MHHAAEHGLGFRELGPPGIATRNTRECLLVQIDALEAQGITCPHARDLVADHLDDLGTRKEVEYAFRIMDEGSSADRQIKVFEQTGDLKAVVDHLILESAEGVTIPQSAVA